MLLGSFFRLDRESSHIGMELEALELEALELEAMELEALELEAMELIWLSPAAGRSRREMRYSQVTLQVTFRAEARCPSRNPGTLLP